jgi:hypothetical protein
VIVKAMALCAACVVIGFAKAMAVDVLDWLADGRPVPFLEYPVEAL